MGRQEIIRRCKASSEEVLRKENRNSALMEDVFLPVLTSVYRGSKFSRAIHGEPTPLKDLLNLDAQP